MTPTELVNVLAKNPQFLDKYKDVEHIKPLGVILRYPEGTLEDYAETFTVADTLHPYFIEFAVAHFPWDDVVNHYSQSWLDQEIDSYFFELGIDKL